MDGILEARSQFQLVELTLDWIEGVEWNVNDVVAPFTDTCDFNKQTSSVISGMLALKQMYPNVGVVNPSYHDLVGLSTKKKTAAGFGALDPTNERIIAMQLMWYLVSRRLGVAAVWNIVGQQLVRAAAVFANAFPVSSTFRYTCRQ
eukprot:jgi/Phyca11/18750/fgenesh1_pg.PHYCAscaffold_40_\